MPNILIVDDERPIADLVELYLKNENFTVYKFYNGTDARTCMLSVPLDPGHSRHYAAGCGWSDTLPGNPSEIHLPIIMLTARDSELDQITGLTLGADDYITKPFRPLELVAQSESSAAPGQSL